jgi:heme-degrading monooxygenase HmoA
MIAAQFIFEPGEYDDEFHSLDDAIEAEAATMPGFLGVDKWVSQDGTKINVIYYFESMSDLTKLGRFDEHRDAKSKVNRWYKGYRVVVTEVTATYGNMPHLASRDA